jgi:hypothetical protein
LGQHQESSGRPGHQRIVGVRDDPAAGGGGQGRPPAAREHPDLRRAVHLIPAQVQQHHHPGAGLLQHRGHELLVHLEHGQGGVRGLGERGDQARLHVGTERVGRDLLPHGTERGRDQPGRGGLPVRAGHQDDLPPAREQREQIGFEAQPDDPADD